MLTMSMNPGDIISGLRGRYVIVGHHGAGGFGPTYRARFDGDGTVCLLVKVLRVARLRHAKALELLEREAALLGALDHPRIPARLDFFAYDGERAYPVGRSLSDVDVPVTRPLRLVLVQVFVPGRTLEERMRRGLRASAAECERLLREMCAVLAYLHGQDRPVIHRDVHPGNIVIVDGVHAVDGSHLVDFGAIEQRLPANELTSTTVGTLGYTPPEQLRCAAQPASDLYALGMTVLAAASGVPPSRMPFDERTGRVLVSVAAPDLGPAMRAAIEAMTEPALETRVATVEGVLRLLDGATEARTDVPAAAARVRAEPHDEQAARRRAWRRALAAIALVLAAAATTIGLGARASAPEGAEVPSPAAPATEAEQPAMRGGRAAADRQGTEEALITSALRM